MRPSKQMAEVLSGKRSPDKCSKAVRSWLRLFVYREAVRVLALPKSLRMAEIEKYALQDELKAEIKRVWGLRRDKS